MGIRLLRFLRRKQIPEVIRDEHTGTCLGSRNESLDAIPEGPEV